MYNGNYEVASLVYIYICICMFKNDIFPCDNYFYRMILKYAVNSFIFEGRQVV